MNVTSRQIGTYSLLNKIGSGGMSSVYKALDLKTKKCYALKEINKQNMEDLGMTERVENEISIHTTLNHPNITKVIEVIYTKESVVIITELCKCDLFSQFNGNGDTLASISSRVAHQILSALDYMHNRGIAHGDLKPENILFDEEYNVKLNDFGSASYIDSYSDSPCTTFYMSPEMILGTPIDKRKSDVWAVGIILHCMFTGCYPWMADDEEEILEIVSKGEINISDTIPETPKCFIKNCLTFHELDRPKVRDLLQERWVNAYARNRTLIRRQNRNLSAADFLTEKTLSIPIGLPQIIKI